MTSLGAYLVRWLIELIVAVMTVGAAVHWLRDRRLTWITFVSFGLRLVVGLGLYSVSLLHLPLMRSLQFEDGFWEFGRDSYVYDDLGRSIAEHLSGQVPHGPVINDPFAWIVGVTYWVVEPSPKSILVLNATAAALCVPLAYYLAQLLGLRGWKRLAVAGLVAFWPSSIAWSGQVMKDSLTWLGVFGVLAGGAFFLRCARQHFGVHRQQALWVAVLIVGSAQLLTRLRGQYLTPSLLIAAAVPTIAVGAVLVVSRKAAGWLSLPLLVLALLAGSWDAKTFASVQRQLAVGLHAGPTVTVALPATASDAPPLTPDLDESSRLSRGPALGPNNLNNVAADISQRPDVVIKDIPTACRPLTPLIVKRLGFTSTGGASVVDRNVEFHSCWDVARYIPRALALSFGAPLSGPRGGLEGSTGSMVQASFADDVILYLLWPGLVAGFLRALWPPSGRLMLAVYVLLLSLLMGFVVANFGTLFRLRLPFVLPSLVLAVDGTVWIATILMRRLGGYQWSSAPGGDDATERIRSGGSLATPPARGA